jgi:flagellar hook assembly protein FlgD
MLPQNYYLTNYPNPFNPTTTISYQIAETGHVNISVYNINGQLVETLINERITEGFYSTIWNANNISSGLYFYKLAAGNQTITKKMLLLK